MSLTKVTGMNTRVFSGVAVATMAILFLMVPLPAIAEDKIATQDTLLDRI